MPLLTHRKTPFKGILIIIFWILSFTYLHSQSQVNFIYDANLSQRFGAENIIAAQDLLFSGQNIYMPHKITNDSTFLKKSLGIGYRFAKLALFESQIDYLFILSQHEIFGHGSCYREFGYSKISYSLNMPFPFGNGSGFSSGRRPSDRLISKTENIRLSISGNEANLLMSDLLSQRFVFNNNMHYRNAQLYLFSKNNLLAYIWVDRAQKGPFGGGDIADYVQEINNLNRNSDKRYTVDKLANQSLISLINPIQLYSLLTIGSYVLKGEESISFFPTIKIKNIQYLPALGYNLTPFGSEYILEQYFIMPKSLIQLSMHLGDNTFHEFYGGGLRIQNIINRRNFQLSNDIKLWQQPAFELGGKYIYNTEKGMGFLISSDCAYYPFKHQQSLGLYTQIGYKTDGYVLGEELGKGLIFRFGISLRNNN